MEDEKRESFSRPRMGRGKMKKRKFQSPKDGEVEDEKRESFSRPRMGRWKMKKEKVSVAQGWGGGR